MKTFDASDLAQFVADIDEAGGPAAPAAAPLLAGMQYRPGHRPDPRLDPFGEDYVAVQLELYREIAGREVDQTVTELSSFDLERHVAGANPYALETPSTFAHHYLRLAHVVAAADLPPAPDVLDMGAGWGMSSEFLATLGCRVHAVDINPAFVELIRRRALRHQMPVTAEQGTFDDFDTGRRFDAILFYECLHHAIRPWTVLDRMADLLKPGGRLLFAGEPINDLWTHWGLRLDPLAVYCTAKFGWFESGWSRPFIETCLARAGLDPRLTQIPDPQIGFICVAPKIAERQGRQRGTTETGMRPPAAPGPAAKPKPVAPPAPSGRGTVLRRLGLEELRKIIQPDEWFDDGTWLISKGRTAITLESLHRSAPAGPKPDRIELDINNFRGKPITLEIHLQNSDRIETQTHILPTGETRLTLDIMATNHITLNAESWNPDAELGNKDPRTIAFHLKTARLKTS